jgi:hypothetical protein
MPDVTVKSIDDMEAIHGGLARRARAELGVTAWGMQVFTLPADWDGYPNHNHGSDAFDPNQEEVYIPLSGAATLVADGSEFRASPGNNGARRARSATPDSAGSGRDPFRGDRWLTGRLHARGLDRARRRSAQPASRVASRRQWTSRRSRS